MDDEYVNIFLWQGDACSLPRPKVLVRESLPIVGGVIKRAVTRTFNSVHLLGYALDRYAGNL